MEDKFSTLKTRLAEIHDLNKTAAMLNWDQRTQMPARGDPSAPGTVLLRRVDDADGGAGARKVQAEIATPPHVAGEGLDAERRSRGPTGEGFEAGDVGGKQENPWP